MTKTFFRCHFEDEFLSCEGKFLAPLQTEHKSIALDCGSRLFLNVPLVGLGRCFEANFTLQSSRRIFLLLLSKVSNCLMSKRVQSLLNNTNQ
jgi:hypothetical protein